MQNLKELYPDADIHFMTKPPFTGLLRTFGSVDKIIPYQKSSGFYLSLLREQYDLVIDLQAKFSTWFLRKFLKTHSSAVYKKKHFSRWLFVKTHKGKGIESTVNLYFSIFQSLDLVPGTDLSQTRYPVLVPTVKNPEHHLFTELKARSKKIIVLFPGAAHQTKMYPPAKWSEVIEGSAESWFFLLLGCSKEDYLSSVLKSQHPFKCENLCGKYSPEQLV